MNKITHYLADFSKKLKHNIQNINTPNAIILGALIISLSILTLGEMGYEISISKVTKNTISATNPLPMILKNIGINKKDFNDCVNSGERSEIVSNSINDGINAEVNGTPSTFILREENGVFYNIANISGAQNKELFKQAIEQALSITDFSKTEKFKGRNVDSNDLQETNSKTKVYVIEYSDAECPFCARLHPTMKELRLEYSGKISFVYRNFPLTSIHQHAEKEAEMISCVGKLGGPKAFYNFIDSIFDYKINNNIGYIPFNSDN